MQFGRFSGDRNSVAICAAWLISDVDDLIQTLRAHAVHLNAISKPTPDAKVFYEVMSGGLIWSDERSEDLPIEVISALRPLFAFRSSLMLGEPEEKWQAYWDTCALLYPRWVGFSAERTVSTPARVRLLKQADKRLKRCLDSLAEENA